MTAQFTGEEPIWDSTSSAVEQLYERSGEGKFTLLCPACGHQFRVAPAEGIIRNTAFGEKIRFIRASIGLLVPQLRPSNRKFRTQGFGVLVYSGIPDKIECEECGQQWTVEEVAIEIETPNADQQEADTDE